MMRSSFRLKFFLVAALLFLSLYLSRRYLLAVCFEKLLSRVSHEQFEFQKKTWEEGSLIYEHATLGSQLSTFKLRLTPDFTLSPLHLSLEVYLTEPHFELSSERATPVYLFSRGNCKTTVHEKNDDFGSVCQPHGGRKPYPRAHTQESRARGWGDKMTQKGVFVMLREFCNCLVNQWISFKLDIERGTLSIDQENIGMIDLVSGTKPDALGTLILSEEEGSAYCTCEASYSQGQFFYQLKCESAPVLNLYSLLKLFSWKPPFQLQGGRMDADLKGTLQSVQGALTGYDLQLATSQGELDLKRLDLQGEWAEQIVVQGSFQGGHCTTDAAVISEAEAHFSFQPENPPTLSMKGKLGFGEIQGAFTCESIGSDGIVKFSGLEIPFSLEQDHIRLNTFTFNSYQCEAILKGSLDKIEGEVSALAPLSTWSQEWINDEESAQFKACFQLQDRQIGWQGTWTAFTDQIELAGALDLKTFNWSAIFESSSVQLSNYSSLFSDGTLAFNGSADSKSAQINLSPSRLQLKTFVLPIHVESGAVIWKEGGLEVKNLQGALDELAFYFPQISYAGDRVAFSVRVPSEEIEAEGTLEKNSINLARFQAGPSTITSPLHLTIQNDNWKMEGAACLALESVPHYLTLSQSFGLFKDAHLPSMRGVLNLSGEVTPENASLDLLSEGLTIGGTSFPALQGDIKQDHNRFETDNLSIGDIHLKGCALYENNKWLFPQWSARYHELELQGSGELDQTLCSLKAEGIWQEIALQAEIDWDIENQCGKKCFLTLEREGLKLQLRTQEFQYKDGKLDAEVQTTASHPKLKESIIAPLSLSWTPDRMIFQGPFSQGAYENDLFKLQALGIHALYEKGIVHFQSKLQLNEAPLRVKGSFNKSGTGVVHLFEGDHQLKVSFNSFSDIGAIEGKLFGIDCSLSKKGTLFEGKLKIETTDPLAALLKKPEWAQFENLEFNGVLSEDSFKGTVTGEEAALKGYVLDSIQASIDYSPTRFEIRSLKIEDPAGQLTFKECHGERSHPLKAWEISIPHLRGQKIQPSLLKKTGEISKDPKPFQIRQLTLTNVTGILGRPLTFSGQGSLYFTQKEKRDPSLFDLPRAFLKEWGLDLALLSPVRGSASVELKQGKMFLQSLKETFSDGDHSEFYLSENEPSYIDFSGALFLNLRMKQNVLLKLAEPFTLSVRGTWQKPLYTLR